MKPNSKHNNNLHKTSKARRKRGGEGTPPTANRRGAIRIPANPIKFDPKLTLSNSYQNRHHSTNPIDYNVDLSWEPSSQDWAI